MIDNLTIIAACSENRVIGVKGKIPWSFKKDRDYFKALCKDKFVIMGRESFLEINHSLPYCKIIVLSKTLKTVPAGCILCRTLEEAISLSPAESIIAGGESLYKQTIPFANKIYLTKIDIAVSGDRFFPSFNKEDFYSTERIETENNTKLHFIEYSRKR